jgi:hypothetical protein
VKYRQGIGLVLGIPGTDSVSGLSAYHQNPVMIFTGMATSKHRKNRAIAFEGVEMSDINRPQLTSS